MPARYEITALEESQVFRAMFASMDPLQLKQLSPKEKKKYICLRKIATLFEPGKNYDEQRVNLILMPVFDDYVGLRRELINFGFLVRTPDGKSYWRNEEEV